MAMPPGPERAAVIRDRAERAHAIPGSRRTRIAAQTLRDWIRIYRRSGFDGLMPKARSDRARPRRMSPDVIETLLAVKRGAPDLSVRQANRAGPRLRRDPRLHAAAALDRPPAVRPGRG